jgi:hypothetical protein
MLLQSIRIVHPDALTTLNRLAEQLTVIFASESSDGTPRLDVDDVISVINEVIKRVSKL